MNKFRLDLFLLKYSCLAYVIFFSLKYSMFIYITELPVDPEFFLWQAAGLFLGFIISTLVNCHEVVKSSWKVEKLTKKEANFSSVTLNDNCNCPVCNEAVSTSLNTSRCVRCSSLYHSDCRKFIEGECAIFGCN